MSYNLHLRWGPRAESQDGCAQNLSRLLVALASIDEIYSSWYKPGRSLKVAQKNKVDPVPEQLKPLFKPKRNDDNEIMSDLGFGNVGLWNGRIESDLEAGFSLNCGKTTSLVSNTFNLHLPSNEVAERRLLNTERALELMTLAITTWSPGFGYLEEDLWSKSVPWGGLPDPELGWLTFLSSAYGSIPELPDPTRSIAVEGHGTIICLTDEPASALRSQHIAQARLVRDVLAASGISVRAPEYELQW